MVARGFASGAETRDRWPQFLVLAGFVAIVAGWLLRLIWLQPAAGGALLALGAAALLYGCLLYTSLYSSQLYIGSYRRPPP